ncbi:MAG: hypothetical protein WB795_09840, partial [Candidatus Acidiferrales bacterium]
NDGRGADGFFVEFLHWVSRISLPTKASNGRNVVKTPTLPKTGEEWGTQKAWKREAKPKGKTRGTKCKPRLAPSSTPR